MPSKVPRRHTIFADYRDHELVSLAWTQARTQLEIELGQRLGDRADNTGDLRLEVATLTDKLTDANATIALLRKEIDSLTTKEVLENVT